MTARWRQINRSRLLFTSFLKRRDLERLDSGFVVPPSQICNAIGGPQMSLAFFDGVLFAKL